MAILIHSNIELWPSADKTATRRQVFILSPFLTPRYKTKTPLNITVPLNVPAVSICVHVYKVPHPSITTFRQLINISCKKNQMREDSPGELERNFNWEATLSIPPSLVPLHPHRWVFLLLSALFIHCTRLPVSFSKAWWEKQPLSRRCLLIGAEQRGRGERRIDGGREGAVGGGYHGY